jgi:hypothetical protein
MEWMSDLGKNAETIDNALMEEIALQTMLACPEL